ncbi:energy-coupling factor transporter transmembrane component T [Candidatus Harpocratesius sp.]
MQDITLNRENLTQSSKNIKSFLLFLYLSEYFVFAFLFDNPIILVLLFILLIIIIWIFKIQKKIAMLSRMILVISLFMMLISTLLNPGGDHVIITLWKPKRVFPIINITLENLVGTGINILRLCIVLYCFGIFNILINNDDLLRILMKLHIPHKIILLITLSLKFFPLLNRDLNHLNDIHKLRRYSVEPNKKNRRSIIQIKGEILLPLLTNSLERSIQIAQALDVRAFGYSKKRTNFFQYKISKFDIIAIINLILLGTGVIYLWLIGLLEFSVYPSISSSILAQLDLFAILFLFFLNLFLILYFSFSKKDFQEEFND